MSCLWQCSLHLLLLGLAYVIGFCVGALLVSMSQFYVFNKPVELEEEEQLALHAQNSSYDFLTADRARAEEAWS